MKSYSLSPREEERFESLVRDKQDLIKLAMIKANVPYKLKDEFYSFALEGLLVSYKILLNGDIDEKDFDKFAYLTMKRKIIDEFRYRQRLKFTVTTPVEDWQSLLSFSTTDNHIFEIDFLLSIENLLTDKQLKFFKHYLISRSLKKTAYDLKIPESSAYKILAEIRKIGSQILLNNL